MDNADKIEQLKYIREKRIRDSKKSFWTFCKTIASDFYKEDRPHLKELCDILQGIYEGTLINPNTNKPYKRLMINMPPRMGKSRTLVLFCQWVFGVDRSNKVITCSYNDTMASDFSRYTRDGIMENTKKDEFEITYNDIFPETKIKKNNGGFEQWALDGQFFSYKGAGVQGSVTGKGCNISIVDDIVKDADVALNEAALEKIWLWYTGTFLSRNEEGGIQIVNMTRWSKNDVCGKILSGEESHLWYVLKMEAYNEVTDEMLCPKLLSKETYLSLKKNIPSMIFQSNYHQKPIDVQGRLYQYFKTYKDLPKLKTIKTYIDTADTGSDYLCCIVYGVYEGEAYILDIYYTQDGMEITEPETAKILNKNKVNNCLIESNNGGRGFSRNVIRILWEKFRNRQTSVKWFHQSKNKIARILTNSTFVMEHIYFPEDWEVRWKEFADDITNYQKQGKNKHDDCADALSGVAENCNKSGVGVVTVRKR